MGSSGSKASALFLKIAGIDVLRDDSALAALEVMFSEHSHNADCEAEIETDAETILSLTYKCVLKAEASNHQGIRDIVIQSTPNNQARNISGELKITDPFARCFVIEQVRVE